MYSFLSLCTSFVNYLVAEIRNLYPLLKINGSVGTIPKLRAGHLRNGSSIPSRGQEILVFSIASRPVLESTQAHIQLVPGTLTPEVHRLNHLQVMTS
jgi:hypothetical protein